MKKLFTFLLALVFVFVLAGCETNFEIEQALMEHGPWANDAIWVDNNSQMYLVCTKSAEEIYADVQAILCVNGQWQEYSLHLYQGVPIAVFVDANDDTFLEARARMKDSLLHLSDFECLDEEISIPYQEITLSRFSRHELADKLPFEIQ